MSASEWQWIERGSSVIVEPVPDRGGLRVEVTVDEAGAGRGIVLPPRAIAELTEWLDDALNVHEECADVHELGVVEAERDAAIRERDEARVELDRLRAALKALPDPIEAPA